MLPAVMAGGIFTASLVVLLLKPRRVPDWGAASGGGLLMVVLGLRGLATSGGFQRVGEPGREICAVARAERIDLIVLPAKRRPGPAHGPPSVGHTARFVVDHAPCPVLLLRGGR